MDKSFQISPAIGFIKVLQKKVGDQSSSNEEERVDGKRTFEDGLKGHASPSSCNLSNIFLVADVEKAWRIVEAVSKNNPSHGQGSHTFKAAKPITARRAA